MFRLLDRFLICGTAHCFINSATKLKWDLVDVELYAPIKIAAREQIPLKFVSSLQTTLMTVPSTTRKIACRIQPMLFGYTGQFAQPAGLKNAFLLT